VRWIHGIERPGRLVVTPRPYGGERLGEDLDGWKKGGVEVVVSTLEAHEAERLDLKEEGRLCNARGLLFLNYPIRDHDVPASFQATRIMAEKIGEYLDDDMGVLVHCFAGLGRSVTLAACAMALRGIPPDFAFEWISEARSEWGLPEREEQRVWVQAFYEKFAKSK